MKSKMSVREKFQSAFKGSGGVECTEEKEKRTFLMQAVIVWCVVCIPTNAVTFGLMFKEHMMVTKETVVSKENVSVLDTRLLCWLMNSTVTEACQEDYQILEEEIKKSPVFDGICSQGKFSFANFH